MRREPRRTSFPDRPRALKRLAGSLVGVVFLPLLPLQALPDTRDQIAQAETSESGDAEVVKPRPARPKAIAQKPAPPKAPSVKPEVAQPNGPKPGDSPQSVQSPPATLAAAAAAGANLAAINISAKLMQNGAGACASTIDAEAVPSMIGVTESNTVSLWSNVEPRDKHATSVFIGQRYGANPAVPYGVTGLISSRTPSGSCDITVVQVVASPLPCAKVRETLAQSGKMLGALAGISLMQTTDSQTLLMPTATNTCVIVGFRAKFGE